MKKTKVSIVVAIGNGRLHNRVIGKDNELLWHIPDDLKQRFKPLTLGHPVIMGRKTYESIFASLGKLLPGRTNIVISRDPSYRGPAAADAIIVSTSIEDALERARAIDIEEVFVIGGGQIYAAALPYVDKLYLTLIDDEKEGDSFFPAYEEIFTKKTFEEVREWNGIKYTWVDLEK